MNREWMRARLYHLFAPLVTLAVAALLYLTPGGSSVGDWVEYETMNFRFKARAQFDPPADGRILFVGIDQYSLDKFGRYPWRRTTVADFLNNVAASNQKNNQSQFTVAFDIMYTEKSDNLADDKALGDAAAQLPNVITGALAVDTLTDQDLNRRAEENTVAGLNDPGPTLPFSKINGDLAKLHNYAIGTLPVDPIREQNLFAFVNDEPSHLDGIRHTVPLLFRVRDKVYPSLALQVLCQILQVDADKVEVNLGQNVVLRNSSGKSWTIPMNDRNEYVINYRGIDAFAKNNLSMGALATALEQNLKINKPLPPECNLDKKAIFIGETATALVDMGPTPIDSRSPLPYVHLNVINNVLQNDYLRFVPWPWVIIGWLLVTWPTLLRLKDAPLIEAVLAPVVAVLFYIIIAFLIFGFWSIQIALGWPVIGYALLTSVGVVLRWKEEKRGREQLKQIFSKMLPSGLVNHVLDHPDNLNLGGQKRPVTILFSDIRDYTKFSEGIDTQELVRQLNIYFEKMVACVEQCRGTLHKFIGDAVMAAWGDIPALSLGEQKDASNAVRSALLMRHRLHELNEERTSQGQIPLRIGIGLNHGIVTACQLGASIRSEFTVIGDAVNVASRLEGITKDFRTDIAISESVRQLVGDEFLVRRLGLIQLKGKTEATVVFEVLAETANLAESKIPPEVVTIYEAAFDHFLARRFAEAAAAFEECEKIYPGDYCVGNYLDFSREFIVTPPPEDWDGRIVMKTK